MKWKRLLHYCSDVCGFQVSVVGSFDDRSNHRRNSRKILLVDMLQKDAGMFEIFQIHKSSLLELVMKLELYFVQYFFCLLKLQRLEYLLVIKEATELDFCDKRLHLY